MSPLRIIFMGTPEFAVPSLEILIEHHFKVVAVVTAPDRPQGRGQKLMPSPVKKCAQKHLLPVLQPTNLKAPEFIDELKSYQANLQVVVAFRMLPESVWTMPSLGTFNLHASLLPQFRGAAPINWAIIAGEKVTGVTTFFLQQAIDTGSILFQESEPILATDDAGSLYDRLMVKGSQLVLKTTEAIQSGTYEAIPQTVHDLLQAAPKIHKETCEINWNQGAAAIHNFVRGLSPHPAAWIRWNGTGYKILRVSVASHTGKGQPGDTESDNKTYLYFKAADGWIEIEELQPEGKKRMTTAEFLRGNKILPGV